MSPRDFIYPKKSSPNTLARTMNRGSTKNTLLKFLTCTRTLEKITLTSEYYTNMPGASILIPKIASEFDLFKSP